MSQTTLNTLHSAKRSPLFTTSFFSALISLSGMATAKPMKIFILAGQSNIRGRKFRGNGWATNDESAEFAIELYPTVQRQPQAFEHESVLATTV